MLGLLLIILAQVGYAFGGLVIRKYLSNFNPLFVTGILVLVSFVFFAPLIFFLFRTNVTSLNVKSAIPFIIAGVLWLVIAESLYVAGFQKAPSITLASLMTLFYPLFSTILGVLFLGESLTIKTVAAAGLMTAGFVLLIV